MIPGDVETAVLPHVVIVVFSDIAAGLSVIVAAVALTRKLLFLLKL